MLNAEDQRLPRCNLFDDLGMNRELVADRGSNEIGSVGIEAFLDEEINLAEIHHAKIDRDLFVKGLGGAGRSEFGHGQIIAPSKWMVKKKDDGLALGSMVQRRPTLRAKNPWLQPSDSAIVLAPANHGDGDQVPFAHFRMDFKSVRSSNSVTEKNARAIDQESLQLSE